MWIDVFTTSHMKYGCVSLESTGKWAWHFLGFGNNESFPPPITLKAKTMRGAKTEAMKHFRKYLHEIAKSLP